MLTSEVAQAIIDLLKQEAEGGIYHFCGDKEVTWNEFACEVFSKAVFLEKIVTSPRVNAITSKQYPTPARRPSFSTLNTMKIGMYQIKASDWQRGLLEVLVKI